MNKIGIIKIIILVICNLFNWFTFAKTFINPIKSGIIPTLILSLVVGILGAFSLKRKIMKLAPEKIIEPNWNDNPISFEYPLRMYHFMGYFFASQGITILIITLAYHQIFNGFATLIISYGIGFLVAINWSLKSVKK